MAVSMVYKQVRTRNIPTRRETGTSVKEPAMKNMEIAAIFDEMAHILEQRKDNPFKVRAYRRAALTLKSLARPVEEFGREELLALPGIGDELAAKILEYCATGAIHALQKLKEEALLTPGSSGEKG